MTFYNSFDIKQMQQMVIPLSKDDVPSIAPVSSYDSSSTIATTESSHTDNPRPAKLSSSIIPTSNILQNLEMEEQMLSMADEEVSLSSPLNISHDHYVSKDDLETLLTPTFMDTLQDTVEDQFLSRQAEQQLRQELIQKELDTILKATEANMEAEYGEEIEPEAVEALDIAANRVAYLKKYYDVATCRYIYVPSVAYTILNGDLLEEASKHYFGKSEEFLVVYAASLGFAVLQQNRLPHTPQVQWEDEQNETDSSNADILPSPQSSYSESPCSLKNQDIFASHCWGVSPNALQRSPSSPAPQILFNSTSTENSCKSRSLFQSFLPVRVLVFLFLLAAMIGIWMNSSPVSTTTTHHSEQHFQQTTRFYSVFPSISHKSDALLSIQAVPVTEWAGIGSNDNERLVSTILFNEQSKTQTFPVTLLATSAQRQKGRNSATKTRPIVPNLLY